MLKIKRLIEDRTINNVSIGIVTGILGVAGTVMILLDAAALANLDKVQIVSWLFSMYFFGGLISIILPIYFKMPITWANSISVIAFLAISMGNFPYSDFIGAYLMSGTLIFLLGITGIFSSLMNYIPKEIVSAMLAGMVTNYVVAIIPSTISLPFVGVMALVGFILAPKISKRFPGVLGAVVFSLLTVILTHPISVKKDDISFVLPELQTPTFSFESFIAITVPLVLLILSNDVAQGIGSLKSFNYKPPVTKIVSISGFSTFLVGFFGGHCSNIGGMMTAMCAGNLEDPMEKRYVSSVVSGIILLLFGIFAWAAVGFIQALPPEFTTIIAGFALIGVLFSNLNVGFSNSDYQFSALFTFVIALSNVQFLNVSSPAWALIIGTILVKVMGEGNRKERSKAVGKVS